MFWLFHFSKIKQPIISSYVNPLLCVLLLDYFVCYKMVVVNKASVRFDRSDGDIVIERVDYSSIN